jgi:hypothetical protein
MTSRPNRSGHWYRLSPLVRCRCSRGSGVLDQNALGLKSQAESAVDVGKANIIYSLGANWIGPHSANAQRHQQENLGRQIFQDGKYAEALQYLNNLATLFRAQHDWTQAQ